MFCQITHCVWWFVNTLVKVTVKQLTNVNRSQQFWLIVLALEYDDIIQIAKHHLCSWTLNHTKPQL